MSEHKVTPASLNSPRTGYPLFQVLHSCSQNIAHELLWKFTATAYSVGKISLLSILSRGSLHGALLF